MTLTPARLSMAIVFVVVVALRLAAEEQAGPRVHMFDILDRNRDGVVTAEEVAGPAKKLEIDLVCGAKGSRLQLVLNTLYHVSKPIENLPYDFYLQFLDKVPGEDAAALMKRLDMDGDGRLGPRERPGVLRSWLLRADENEDGFVALPELHRAVNRPGRYAAAVESAIPFCLGDSFQSGGGNYRVIGTVPAFLDLKDKEGAPLFRFAAGRNIHHDYRNTSHFFEAVIGADVARRTGLKIGDTFQPTHGIRGYPQSKKHESFTVVGVLAPTGTPHDEALFVNMEGFYVLDGHSLDGKKRILEGKRVAGPLPLEQREITTLVLRAKNDFLAMKLRVLINEGNIAQAARPIVQILDALYGADDVSRFYELGAAIRAGRGKVEKSKFTQPPQRKKTR